jgi:hypothetical protein
MRGINPKHRHRVHNDIESVSVIPYPEDSMAFRLPDWHNMDEEISRVGSPEENADGVDDGFLGLWPGVLDSEVFGLPEKWIVLLLCVVLLGKEKDAVEQGGSLG